MQIEDKQTFISEYSQLVSNKKYKEVIDTLTNRMETIRKKVFLDYTSEPRYVEPQVYNEKNKAVSILSLLLEVKEMFENINLPWCKYMLDELNDRIEWHTKMIETQIGWLQTGLTMAVYTESDLQLQEALAIEHIVTSYDKELERCKKEAKSESTLTEVEGEWTLEQVS